ncbi:MAG: family metalloprotease domain protein [Bacteroidetes bacterium]|nr:family metalloprotease domain protein [Bacteroidota bacterium]
MKKAFTQLLFIAILLISQISMAVPAYKGLVQLSQPNGTEVSAYLLGDERISWVESEDNYTLMYNKQGYLEYAIKDQAGDILPSGIIAKNQNERSMADVNFLSTIQKKLRYSQSQIDLMLQMTEMLDNRKSQGVEGLTVGIRKLLVILVGYSDFSFTYTRQDFENLFNQIGYTANQSTGSVRDYFATNSYGKLDLQCTVVGPFILPQTRAFYGAETATQNDVNAKQMIIDGCYAADSIIDFSVFDNDANLIVDGIHVVYAGKGQHNGGGANAIWAHRSKLNPALVLDGVRIIDYSCASEKNSYNTISGVGVHIHEFGHVLGLLDYYDTDYNVNGISKTFSSFEVMDEGAYNNNEKTPPLYNAYSKVFLGWASPFIIDSTMLMDVTSIPSSDSGLVYRINTPKEGEYFLFENLSFLGWNGYLHSSIRNYRDWLGGGNSAMMAIHVDESASGLGWGDNCLNCYSSRNSVRLMSANGQYIGSEYGGTSWSYSEMANMIFPGNSAVTSITDETTTNLKSWDNLNSKVSLTEITKIANSNNISFKVNGGAALGVQIHTLAPTQITHTSAKISGSAQASLQGDQTIIERGFVINTEPYPILSNNKIIVSGTTGSFDSTLTGLNAGTTYYYRTYGINANGVAYGEQFSFLTTSDPITNNAIVDSNFAACETGEMPTILGTEPQGGSGEYTYRWFESTDNINWTITQNAGIKKDYTPSTLTVPTYFRRVVLSSDKADTSASKLVPIVPMTVAGTLSIQFDTISVDETTGQISLSGQVGDVVVWQRKFENQQWAPIENSGQQTTISQILTDQGQYQYRVRVRNGACPSKTTSPVTIYAKIGLFDIDVNSINFNIYPNPSKGEFTLDLSLANKDKVDVQIINLLGKTVYVKENVNSKTQINVSSLENGTYILILKDEDEIIGKKQLVITK